MTMSCRGVVYAMPMPASGATAVMMISTAKGVIGRFDITCLFPYYKKFSLNYISL